MTPIRRSESRSDKAALPKDLSAPTHIEVMPAPNAGVVGRWKEGAGANYCHAEDTTGRVDR